MDRTLIKISFLFSLGFVFLLDQSYVALAYPVATTEYGNETYEWRLMDGDTEYEGRLEMRRNDTEWFTVDSYGMSSHDIKVVCGMFGYSHGLSYDKSGTQFGHGDTEIKLTSIICEGTEESLLHCRHGGFGNSPRASFGDAQPLGVTCLPGGTTLQIRLDNADYDIDFGGPLEMYDGVQNWGQICAIGWDQWDADTACRQLGYQSALMLTSYPHDDMDFLYTHPHCSPDDELDNLADCEHYGFDECRCTTKRRAGAICNLDDSAAPVLEFKLERLSHDTFYDAGVILGRRQGEQEWRTMCFEQNRMSSGAYSVALSMCETLLGEKLATHQVIGYEEEQDPKFATTRRSIYAGNIGTYPTLEINNAIELDVPCSRHGYVSIHAVCQHTIFYNTVPVSLVIAESCIGKCGFLPDNINCRCDPECDRFQDCCLDYHDVCTDTQMMAIGASNSSDPIARSDYECLQPSADVPDASVIKTCLGESRSFLFVRYKCENEPIDVDATSSILQRWPVYDNEGRNFRNIFCAICNGKEHIDYDLWSVDAPIRSLHTNFGGFLSFGGKRRRRRQAFGFGRQPISNPQLSTDPCSYPGQDEETDETTEISVGMKLRFCAPEMIGTCPPDYPYAEIVEACESYSARKCGLYDHGTIFKNPHCMVCNEADDEYFRSCDPVREFLPGAFYDLYFAFEDTSVTANEMVDMTECSFNSNSILNPMSGECQHLDCPAGYRLNDDNQCVFQQHETDIRDGKHCAYKNTHLFFSGVSVQTKVATMDCVVDKLLEFQPTTMDGQYTDFKKDHLKWDSNDQSAWGVSLAAKDTIGEEMIRHFADQLASNSTLAEEFTLYCSAVEHMEIVHTCKKYDVVDDCSLNWRHGSVEDFTRVDASSLVEIHKFHNQYLIPDFLFAHSALVYDVDNRIFMRNDDILLCGHAVVPLVDDCHRMTVEHTDYMLETSHGQGTVLVYDGVTYGNGEYILIPDGRAEVCDKSVSPTTPNNDDTNDDNSTSYKFMNMNGMVLKTAYLTGTLLSLAALVGTMGIYIIISNLLDYHGRVIFSVVLSIFVGQSILLVTKLFNVDDLVCTILSAVGHYAWLAAFNWMNVLISQLAYHYVFLKVSAIDDVSSRCEIVLSNLAGWGIPLLIGLVTGALHMLGPIDDFHIRYGGQGICWIKGAVSDLLAFGVPVATTILYCTAMSLLTSAILRRARTEATDLRGGMDWADGLCKLYQFIKIGIMMALMWILTYMAVHIDTVGFWWLFVIANTALGIFICAYVITNQRTKTAWQMQYGKKQNIQDSSINNVNAKEKNKAAADCGDKMNVKNITTSFSVRSDTTTNNEDGVANGSAATSRSGSASEVSDDDNNKGSAVKADNVAEETAPERRADDEAPLNEDKGSCPEKDDATGAVASGGAVNEGAEFEGDDEAAQAQAKAD